MGLSDALNSLVSSLKGSNSVQKSGGTGNNNSAMNEVAEEAIGNQLANIGKEEESAKTIEEKANAALEDLMGKLGLSASDAEETLGELKNVFKEEIQERKEVEKTEETKETEEAAEDEIAVSPEELPEGWSQNDNGQILDKDGNVIGRVETVEEDTNNDGVKETVEKFYIKTEKTDEEKDIEDKLDEMTDEELEALYESIGDRLEFSDEEAKAYVDGEAEVKARIEEAVENNPDMDPAEIEAQIRAAYELENPEYAEAKKEAEAVMEKHDKAMDEAYTAYCEENPKPVEEDFDSPAEYTRALNEWSQKAEQHMRREEAKYRKENENYDNLKDAEGLKMFQDIDPSDLKPLDPFEPIDIMPTTIIRPEPIRVDPMPTKIIKPTFEDPGFSKIIEPTFDDPGIEKIIDNNTISILKKAED